MRSIGSAMASSERSPPPHPSPRPGPPELGAVRRAGRVPREPPAPPNGCFGARPRVRRGRPLSVLPRGLAAAPAGTPADRLASAVVTSDDELTRRSLSGWVSRREGGPEDRTRGGHGEAPAFAQLFGEEQLGVVRPGLSGSQDVLNGTFLPVLHQQQ